MILNPRAARLLFAASLAAVMFPVLQPSAASAQKCGYTKENEVYHHCGPHAVQLKLYAYGGVKYFNEERGKLCVAPGLTYVGGRLRWKVYKADATEADRCYIVGEFHKF